MPDRFGADPERWRYFSETLGLTADLLPVVSNPNATIGARSTLKKLGKTPSRYNSSREAVGIQKWTSRITTSSEIERWAKEPDLGICVQTRRLRAIDVDVPALDHSRKVTALLTGYGDPLLRLRRHTGRVLMPFWFHESLAKHVVPVEGGIVEILGDGQQFVAEGLHESGERYEWVGSEIPELDPLDFAILLGKLREIATGEIRIAHQRKANGDGRHIEAQDDVAEWLVSNWEIHDHGQDGQIFIACPFAGEHSTDTGPSSTAYFPAGTGGHAEGRFVCLHAHCTGRGQAEFLNAVGFTAGQFDTLGPDDGNVPESVELGSAASLAVHPGNRVDRQTGITEKDWPTLKRDKSGILPSMDNLLKVIARPDLIGRHIASDSFKDVIVWAPHQPGDLQWRLFRDVDYAHVQRALEQRGFKAIGRDNLRLAVLAVATDNEMDTAKEWLKRLRWDGIPRIETFAIRGWGWADTPYSRAVGRYVWTALAGRVLEPGCQADMAPVLIGAQGARKTSAIKAMVPDPEFYTEINLAHRDDDTSRKMRGTLVAELEELRGLNSRAQEEILAFVTRTHEEWTPKWREFSTRFARRMLFFGSGNDEQFLNNPHGERRWLPGRCDGFLDVEWIAATRDQLWAEGAALFTIDGIQWQDAESLARAEHAAFKVSDAWTPYVRRWLTPAEGAMEGLEAGRDWLTISEALTGAVGLNASQIDRGKEMRMGNVLRDLGWIRVRRRIGDDTIQWVYEKEQRAPAV